MRTYNNSVQGCLQAIPPRGGRSPDKLLSVRKPAHQAKAYYSHLPDYEQLVPGVDLRAEQLEVTKLASSRAYAPQAPLLDEYYLGSVLTRWEREIVHKGVYSDQFPDVRRTAREQTQIPALQAVFNTFSATDPSLISSAIAKRFRFMSKVDNFLELEDASQLLGPLMWASLQDALDLPDVPSAFEPEIWDECVRDFEQNRLGKNVNVLTANWRRSDPDRTPYFVDVAPKQEIKAKRENINGPFKAGQTLTVYGDPDFFHFAPLVRYLWLHVLKFKDPSLYIHLRQSTEQLDEWCRRYVVEGESSTNDFTGFDGSNRGPSVYMECELMINAGVPSAMIEDYRRMRTNTVSRFGVLGIMRASGDFATFDFNTYNNIAVTHLRYNIPRRTPTAAAGDDIYIGGVFPETELWPIIAPFMPFVFKPEVSTHPAFVSWRLTPHGCFKDPLLVYLRNSLSTQRGTGENTIVSYFAEHSYLARQYEIFQEYLTDHEREAHSLNVRIFHKARASIPFYRSLLLSPHEASALLDVRAKNTRPLTRVEKRNLKELTAKQQAHLKASASY
jgi:hypothetical protein